MRIGIMSALPEENSLLVKKTSSIHSTIYAEREYITGFLHGHEIVLVFSSFGKAAANMTAEHLIKEFKVDAIIFTGVAGGCAPLVKIGDIVIAESLVEHDIEVESANSGLEIISYQTTEILRELSLSAANAFLKGAFLALPQEEITFFGISSPHIHQGIIASGEKFFSSEQELLELQNRFPGTLCVEMEGVAVAQVCHEQEIPFAIIRTISDHGNETSPQDFKKFVLSIASFYSLGILEELLPRIDPKK